MKLKQLFEGVSALTEIPDAEVNAVTCDSRQAVEGCVFFCVKGEKADGHNYAATAADNGAAAIIAERDLGLPGQVLVEDTRLAYSLCSQNFFDNPARKLKLIGVTGTNGKTTTAFMIKSILNSAGKTAGLLGTIHNEIGDMIVPARHTTPDPMQFNAMLCRMVEAGCEYAVMEVSSHALDQLRVAGVRFAAAAFTNLTQDHLDYHGDMESYYQAKKKLFAQCETAVVNIDDEYGRRLLSELSGPKLTFSCESDAADYTARDIKINARGSRFSLLCEGKLARVRLAMPGRFCVANAMAAAVCCLAAGIGFQEVVDGLAECPGVPGRVEILSTEPGFTILRDYAHSPDGLEKILEALRELSAARIVTLFGCAGNRDRTKRPVMAEIVARLSDFCILTSDNPRDESPQRIIDDALPGFETHKTPYKAIVDRYSAIEWALDFCREGDILLLAGKGHEDYQVLDFGTIYFDEKVIVNELLGKRKNREV